MNTLQEHQRSCLTWLFVDSVLPSRYRPSCAMSRILSVEKLTLGHAKHSRTSCIIPQHEEAIWNKLHRYFSNKLDGI